MGIAVASRGGNFSLPHEIGAGWRDGVLLYGSKIVDDELDFQGCYLLRGVWR
jgi:hypothetical protein